jgi:peptidoglycan hydrolase-like protein with peptidoglycan-binding domain
MYGSVPAWRTLKKGVADGADVRELERNLVELGFDPKHGVTVDDHFGAATAKAVERWQKKLGAAQTGRVRLGTIVFLPGARLVGTLETEVGAQVQTGATIMQTSSTRQAVTVDLDTTKQSLAAVGNDVTVTLPSGDEVPGTISSVGKVAQSSSSSTQDQGQGQSSSTSTITVTIKLGSGPGVDLDQAPVSVAFAQQTRKNVLAVPVTALLSLLGGGYAVEVSDGTSQTHLVAVTPGLYAGGYVEITGDGIEQGTKVVVPQ